MKSSCFAAVRITAAWLLACCVWGQTSQVSQVSGAVQDATGAAIPDAEITITTVNTAVARTVRSGRDGSYLLSNLPPGPYTLRGSKEGFAPYVQSGIVLEVNTNPQINITLNVGGITQQIEVVANAAQVETHDTGVGQVIDQERVLELPLNGRQVTQLVTLSGAANDFVPTSAGQSLISNKNYPTSAAFSVAGGQGGQTLFVLDGGNHMDPISNIGLPMPFPDALQEFKVETSSLPANYGSQPGGVINVITRGGGNEFHGDAFEFIRNYALNARNFFAPKRDSLKRNQFGGTIGGPVIKNKLFFFGGYQGTFEKVAPAANINYVATAAALQGDFTGIASCGNVTLKAPFVGNKVPITLLNPVALNLLKQIPVSTDPCGKLTYGIPSSDHENQYVVRSDWQVNEKHSFFARYFITDYQHPPYYTNNLLTMSTDASVGLADRVNSAVAGENFIITPNMISSFRASFSRASVVRYTPAGAPTPTQLGANVTQGVPGYAFINISSYFTPMCQNCSPGPWISTNYQLSEQINWIRGAHQVAFGVTAQNSRLNSFGNFSRNGNFTFNGQNTGNSLADFMLGRPSSFTQNNGQIGDERLTIPALFVQDNLRLSSHFNVSAGLRWDPYLSPWKAVPQVSIFDLGWYNADIRSQVFTNAPAGTLFVGDPGMPGKHYFNSRWGEFAPRLGVVYDPRGKGLETIRAGYGLFYGAVPLFLQNGTHAPFAFPASIPNPAGGFSNPYAGSTYGTNPFPLPSPLPSNVAFPQFGGGLGFFKLNPKPTYMEQWNLALQKQFAGDWLLSASYLGNRTLHLEIGEPLNPAIYIPGNCVAGQYGLSAPGPCSNQSNTNFRRVLYLANPLKAAAYSAVGGFGDGAIATYDALLLSAQHRLTHNFTVLANYTWSHCLTQNEVALNGGGSPQDSNDRAAEYGNCLSDRRQVFNLTSVVRTPKFSGTWMQRILGDWQESTIFTKATGTHVTPATGFDTSLTGSGTRPNAVGSPDLSNATIAKWFNTSAFTPAPTGSWGNSGVGVITGPGAWNVDVALSREFRITERQKIDFRAEAFNLFNHARFGNPDATLNSPTYGQIFSARDPRILQGALKYVF
jgi:hypothetical protein